MNRSHTSMRWAGLVASLCLLTGLSGCGGGGGSSSDSPTSPETVPVSGISTGATGLAAATALKITVTRAVVAGKPEVDFTVTNQNNAGMTGLTAADLRFNIAKLMLGPGGATTDWQNYINRARNGAVQGTQERQATGAVFGTLVGHGGGAYTYTFATDITDPAANPCPAPCTDAKGKPLDVSYAPTLTHRITIQQANSAYPEATGVFDFVPAGGSVATARDVVATATCNTCHGELKAHGTRVDTKLCVTCHNPGSWVAGSPNVSVDFKVMVHRIHYNNAGAALPSVVAGTAYKIGSTDFSAVTFTQDARNCNRCHTGTAAAAGAATTTATPQGDHWKTMPSMEACQSCHDNVYFGAAPDPTKAYQTKPHTGGAMADSSTCAMCHADGKYTDAKDIGVAHDFPARLKAATAKFKYQILSVTGTTAGAKPVVTFSVVDPTNGDAPYELATSPAFTAGAASTLNVKLGWSTAEMGNDGSGLAFAQPITINALTATPGGTAGTYVVTSPTALPAGLTGTLRVMMDGHPAGNVTNVAAYTDRLPVKSVFKDVAVSGSVVARRVVVDVAKCNVCHDTLSLHGNNRSDEVGVCVICHNANATDASRRPTSAGVLTGGVDGKPEESIDFKTMIHAIHAGQASKGGMRTKGLTVYGFGGSVNDFSAVVFPGKLNDCSNCHVGVTYSLTGIWTDPVKNKVLGTTVSTGASTTLSTDNLRISPTAAVCASCHDGAPARAHMQDPGSGGLFSATQATLQSATAEGCVLCHGDGKVFDVKTVHGVK